MGSFAALPTRSGVLLVFNVGSGDDSWLRDKIRGTESPEPKTQAVVVQNFREANRVMDAMARLKHERKKAYGGCWSQKCEFVF